MLPAKQANVPLHIGELMYRAPRELLFNRLVVTITGVSLLRRRVQLLTTARTLFVVNMCFGEFGRLSTTSTIGNVGPRPVAVSVVGGRHISVPCVLKRDAAVGTPIPSILLRVGTPSMSLLVPLRPYRAMSTKLSCPVTFARLVL